VPKLASGLCAFGQIISDVKYNYMATSPVRLNNDAAYAALDALFRDIEAKGRSHLVADGFDSDRIDVRRTIDMRYVGQVHECSVEIGNFAIDGLTICDVKDAFHRRHEELYAYAERHTPVEAVNIESTLYGRIDKPAPPRVGQGPPAREAQKGSRNAIFTPDGRRQEAPVYDGERLGAGATIEGPAIIEETTTTIVIEPGWMAVLDPSGSYVIRQMIARAPDER
jgi:N-methylhydantoinase A